MTVISSILVVLLLALVYENFLHRRNLKKIPLRIHVNGTRGKSSVTRLIAAGLRAGGVKTCAKTTGSSPRMILDDGSEYTIQRQGRANILEQVRAVSIASRRNAESLVTECMALNPKYQAVTEDVMIRSSIGVITNARPDHLDVMGPTVVHVAMALSATIPKKGTLITAETSPGLLAIFKKVCEKRGAELIVTNPTDEGITDEMMRGFSYVEHPDNVAVALRTCIAAGVDAQKALDGMFLVEPDVGALRILRLAFWAKEIDFVNAFAANDPDSTFSIWQQVLNLCKNSEHRIVILNCRSDRPNRSTQLGAILSRLDHLDLVLFTGTGTRLAMDKALAQGLHPEKMLNLEHAPSSVIFERSMARLGSKGLVFGMGNIGGGGSDIAEYFQNRAIPREALDTGEAPWKT